jgi:hypothetical protein
MTDPPFFYKKLSKAIKTLLFLRPNPGKGTPPEN